MGFVEIERLADDFLDAIGLSRRHLAGALRTLLTQTHLHWIEKLAERELDSSALDYIRALNEIGVVHAGGLVGAIVLAGEPKIAQMVEHGAAPFDMRQTLLKDGTSNLRVSAAGHKYLHVPFRHLMSPTSEKKSGRPIGTNIQHTFAGRSGATNIHVEHEDVAKKVRRSARKLKRYRRGGRSSKMRLPTGTGGVERFRPHHKTDIYAGMVRFGEQHSPKGGSAGYFTFRTISENPETVTPEGWQHPGIQARNLAHKARRYAVRIWPGTIKQVVRGMR